jgi:hypothetical protein
MRSFLRKIRERLTFCYDDLMERLGYYVYCAFVGFLLLCVVAAMVSVWCAFYQGVSIAERELLVPRTNP